MSVAPSNEQLIWKGHPSQSIYFGTYLLCILLCFLIVPIFIAIAKVMEVRAIVYEVTTDRLRIARGVFKRRADDIELYRVRDYTVEQNFFQRMFGVADLKLVTSDKTTPLVILQSIHNAEWLRDEIRNNVERLRKSRGVREIDME